MLFIILSQFGIVEWLVIFLLISGVKLCIYSPTSSFRELIMSIFSKAFTPLVLIPTKNPLFFK